MYAPAELISETECTHLKRDGVYVMCFSTLSVVSFVIFHLLFLIDDCNWLIDCCWFIQRLSLLLSADWLYWQVCGKSHLKFICISNGLVKAPVNENTLYFTKLNILDNLHLSKHAMLFWRWCNVVWTLIRRCLDVYTTLFRRWNEVVCWLGYGAYSVNHLKIELWKQQELFSDFKELRNARGFCLLWY